MARANEENSANSQFFIVFYPRFNLDKRYTNFGRVIENIGNLPEINRGFDLMHAGESVRSVVLY